MVSGLKMVDYEMILEFIFKINQYEDNYKSYVLKTMAKIFDYEHLTFLTYDGNQKMCSPVGINIKDSLNNSYEEYFYKQDMFLINTINNGQEFKKVIRIQDIMPYGEYEKTIYYNEFLKEDNLYYEMAIPLKIKAEIIGGIGVFKSKNEGDFTFRDYQMLQHISDHIALAFKNNKEIQEKEGKDIDSILRNKYLLTKREVEIALLVETGLGNKQISEALHISFHTVKAHLEKIFIKLKVANRTEMVYCIRKKHI